jgi:arylformamidase
MPYILSGLIHPEIEPQWREGAPYSTQRIYDIHDCDPDSPPVNYDAHLIKPHSLCHVDAPAHVIPGGATVDQFFSPERRHCFFGPAVVVKIAVLTWTPVAALPSHFVHRVGLNELKAAIERVTGLRQPPSKLLISADPLPTDRQGLHDPRYALVLDEEAARWLCSSDRFSAYGTSWKSTDFQPGSRDRPIHRLVFEKGVIFECLDLAPVPQGQYFLSGFPLPLKGASEAPVCPVLYRPDELDLAFD